MGNYNPVYKSLWTSQKFNLLDANEKLIFLYLLTNEKVKQTGIYNIMVKHIACECGLMLPETQKAVNKMQEIGLIHYWDDENLIYIRNFFRFSKGMIRNPKILAETINRQKELLANHSVWDLFDRDYAQEIQSINKALMNLQTNNSNSDNKHISKIISISNHSNKNQIGV